MSVTEPSTWHHRSIPSADLKRRCHAINHQDDDADERRNRGDEVNEAASATNASGICDRFFRDAQADQPGLSVFNRPH
jgi:hypothetical protein